MRLPVDREHKMFSIPNFTGGLTSFPAQDNEAVTLTNIEPSRDGDGVTIYGSLRVNSNDVVADPSDNWVMDLFCGGIYDQAWALVAATTESKLYVATSTDFSVEIPITFVECTPSGGIAGSSYWAFAEAADVANNQIILGCNFTDGLHKFDNSAPGGSGLFEPIAAAPPSPECLCQYEGYTLLGKGNNVYISDYLDPETWPGANLIALSGAMGDVSGVVPLPGKCLVICRRGLMELRGTKLTDFIQPIDINATIGCTFPRTISSHGNDVGFLHFTGPYIYNTGEMSVQYIGEPIKEYFTSTVRDLDLTDSARYYWRGFLSKDYYILCGREKQNPFNRICLVFSRRLNCWFEITPPEGYAPMCFTSSETAKIVSTY